MGEKQDIKQPAIYLIF